MNADHKIMFMLAKIGSCDMDCFLLARGIAIGREKSNNSKNSGNTSHECSLVVQK